MSPSLNRRDSVASRFRLPLKKPACGSLFMSSLSIRNYTVQAYAFD